MTPTNLLVPTFAQMLTTLTGWLTKAQAQLPEGEAEVLLSARLADDMYPLSTQIRFACVQAHEAVARLRGEVIAESVREMLDEARKGGEHPGSIADAQVRIAQTTAMLDSLSPDELDTGADKAIVHTLPNGMIFDLTAEQYVRDWALPQFYFHLMAAYSILRNQGVSLGKKDYIPHMFQYLREGTAPAR